jgi:hydrogenase nickel incorporation protein HypA/HybF
MHERALARQIVEASVARAEGAARVVAVHGWVAETEALSRESLEAHFASCALGTIAEGARLEFQVTHVAARCSRCGATFSPEAHVLVCPSCGGVEVAVLGRTGLGIDRIVVEAR